MRVVMLLVMLLGVWVSQAEAADHFIRAGMTGTGTCNSNGWNATSACPTLPAVLTRGDTYWLADGSYGGYTFDDAPSGTTLITVKKATATSHGTETGWDPTYGDGQAIFSSGFVFTTAYWVIDGVTGGGPQNNWNQNFGFKVIHTNDGTPILNIGYSGSPSNITMSHIDMQGKGSVTNSGGFISNDGVGMVSGASNITLTYAWMHGIGRCPVFMAGDVGGFAIFDHVWVQSYFGSDDFHSEVMSASQGSVPETTWRYSLFTDIQSTGGLMWDNSVNPSAHLYVYGNIFYKPAGAIWGEANGLIGGWTGGHGEVFRNVSVYNNTFINVDQQSLSTFPNISSGNSASNNLWYNSQSPEFAKFTTHDYNHFINSGGTHAESNGSSAASGNPFIDYPNLNFALTGATAAGTTLASPFNLDPLGKTRGAEGVWDRGAFEFGSTDTTPPAAPTGVTVSQLGSLR